MSQKNIYGAIELVEHEIRFVLGEFHNGQLNIMKTMAQATDAITGVVINDQRKLVSHIRLLMSNVEKQLGFSVKKLILIIPSDNVIRDSKRLNVLESETAEYVDPKDVGSIINELSRSTFDERHVVVDKVVNRYIVDGVSSRRVPTDRKLKRLSAEIDIYSGETALIFDYISVIEAAGYEILDIYFDSYCIAKEAAILDISNIKNMILLRYERSTTTLSLFKDGRIISSIMEDIGYQQLIDMLMKHVSITEKNAEHLILSNNYLDGAEDYASPVYVWEEEKVAKSVTEQDLEEILEPVINEHFKIIREMAEPILALENTEVYVVGKGSSIIAIADKAAEILEIPSKVYIPETIGARKGCLTACLGALYAYHDQNYLRSYSENSIEMSEFTRAVEIRKSNNGVNEDSMTNRFKELLGMNKE